jgi:hypothetical protein
MIIDPDSRGCTIWHNGHVTSVKGSPEEICHEIYTRTTYPRMNVLGEIKCIQILPIAVDVCGEGVYYKRMLEGMGLKLDYITPDRLDNFLPVMNQAYVRINVNYSSDNEELGMHKGEFF